MKLNPVIWLYWEGPMPAYIALCLELIRDWHPGMVQLLDRETFEREWWRHDRDVPLDRLTVLHRSDWIRSYLLRWHGGMYSDLDCIPLRSWRPWLDQAWAAPAGFCGYHSTGGTIGANFMASRPGGTIITLQYEEITHNVRHKEHLEWLDVSSVPMTRAVGGREGLCRLYPNEMVQPILWSEQDRMYEEAETFPVQPDAWCYMLSNQCLGDRVRQMCRQEILEGRTRLGYLLRESRRRLTGPAQPTPDAEIAPQRKEALCAV